MTPELLSSIGSLVLLSLGVLLLYIAWIGIKMSLRARNMPTRPGYDEATCTSGIFVEHGMVYDPDSGKLKAQQKPSDAWYELFFRR